MRIRIQTLPPFPKVKAWFASPPQISVQRHQSTGCACQDHPLTILELKDLLCLRVCALKEAAMERSNVALFRDEYELLDESLVTDVLAEGEEVIIKYQMKTKVDEQSREDHFGSFAGQKTQADMDKSPSTRPALKKKEIDTIKSSEGGKVPKRGRANTESRPRPYPVSKPKTKQIVDHHDNDLEEEREEQVGKASSQQDVQEEDGRKMVGIWKTKTKGLNGWFKARDNHKKRTKGKTNRRSERQAKDLIIRKIQRAEVRA